MYLSQLMRKRHISFKYLLINMVDSPHKRKTLYEELSSCFNIIRTTHRITDPALHWRIMVNQIICYLTVEKFVQADIKENCKVLHHWPLGGKSSGRQCISLSKGQYCRKRFHSMTSSCVQQIHLSLTITPYDNRYTYCTQNSEALDRIWSQFKSTYHSKEELAFYQLFFNKTNVHIANYLA